jgi:pilus assembly protein CpaE
LKKSLEVLLLTSDSEITPAVEAAVAPLAEKVCVSRCRDVAALKTQLLRLVADPSDQVAVVVDIDLDPKRVLFEVSRVVRGFATAHCVVISQEFSEALVLQAMQAGARHFLRKSSIAGELATVLQSLLAHESETPSRLGDILSVFSCGGGCGATTVAVNLAQELRLAAAEPTLVVDLDEHYGSVAAHLGVAGRFGVGHTLAREGTIDRHLIESTAVRSGGGVDVLLSPVTAEAETGQPLRYDNLLRMLDACRESHRYVIVDAPRISRQSMAELASVSRLVVVVFQLTVRDVASAKSIMSFLSEQEMDRDRILLLANRARKRGSLLRLEDSRRAIGTESIYRVRNHWRKAVKSMNRGEPLALSAGRSAVRRDYRKLAAQIRRSTTNGE